MCDIQIRCVHFSYSPELLQFFSLLQLVFLYDNAIFCDFVANLVVTLIQYNNIEWCYCLNMHGYLLHKLGLEVL